MTSKNTPANKAIAFHGTIIHSTSLTTITILQDATLIVNPHGDIIYCQGDVSKDDLPATLARLGLDQDCTAVKHLTADQFLIPGFVDTHNHAPQWQQRGLGQGMELLDWLAKITFPNEARFADPEHAKTVYADLVAGMLRQGVTTASYYSSLHGEATRILADTCLAKGQRAFVGKCNMNRESPEYYRDASVEESLEATQQCIDYIRKLDPDNALLRYVITPRFAISCEGPLLEGLGDMAQRNPDVAIQTHFNEAQGEMDATRALFPEFSNEVDLYEHFNLLTPRTILAHCTIMTDAETARLRELGCGVAHCPAANMTVGGGFMAAPVRDFLNRGIKVGLGTDSGGGYSSSILDAMRLALIASFAREAMSGGKLKGLSIEEVFYLATVGGAAVMGLDGRIGNFETGKQFDAIVVDVNESRGAAITSVTDQDSIRHSFEKFIMTGDDRNMVEVYVGGKKVHGSV